MVVAFQLPWLSDGKIMQRLFCAALVFLVVSVVLAAYDADKPGEKREWTLPCKGGKPEKREAKFLSVESGIVSFEIWHVEQGRDPHNPRFTKNYSIFNTIKVPLCKLTPADRLWIEDRNQAACCIKAKSRKGTVGTLSLGKGGKYHVEKVLDDKTIIIKQFDGSRQVWTFVLSGATVVGLTEGQDYQEIGILRDKEGHFASDFVVVGKSKKQANGNIYDVVESAE